MRPETGFDVEQPIEQMSPGFQIRRDKSDRVDEPRLVRNRQRRRFVPGGAREGLKVRRRERRQGRPRRFPAESQPAGAARLLPMPIGFQNHLRSLDKRRLDAVFGGGDTSEYC